MGLGPPVCEKCRVVSNFDVDTEKWICPICDNTKCQWHMLDCGLTEEELDATERFLRFVKGTQDA